MSDAWSLKAKPTNEPTVRQLARPLPDGVQADTSFAADLLEAYAGQERSSLATYAVAALAHYRLAAVAAAAAERADPAALELDFAGGAALWHAAEAVVAAGRWLAEAFDLRLSPRATTDPASKNMMGRMAFADPALHGELREQQAWLAQVQRLGRRASDRPLALRAADEETLAAPQGRAPAGPALAAHLANLDRFLRAVTAAAGRQHELGPRPVREEPDEAWLSD
jgi:hypothetical protein